MSSFLKGNAKLAKSAQRAIIPFSILFEREGSRSSQNGISSKLGKFTDLEIRYLAERV
jgi:hypothetical protein